jgi:hypothetical protein
MRIYLACALVLMLAACGSGKSKSGGDSSDNDKWSTNGVKRENTSGSNSSSGGSNKSGDSRGNSGASNGAGNSVKEPDPEPEPEPVIDEPVARTDIEGKVTEFKHVVALWDEVNHSVRFVASTQAIPASQYARLRNGDPLEGGEIPHIIFSFVLNEGTTTMNKGKVENWFYDFYWLTSLSPASLRNIGKETISVMNGSAKVGETLKLVIKFESAKVKDAPAEKFDFEVQFEVVLQ